MVDDVVTVLCSGIGLGVYNPALILSCRLKNMGVSSEVLVIESFFKDNKKEKLIENKRAFHKSFKLAILGIRMPMNDFRTNLDNDAVNRLLEYWHENKRRHFIVLSGHWMGIINEYVSENPDNRLIIDTLHMDCDMAPSWRNFENAGGYFNDIWLPGSANKKIEYRVDFGNGMPVPFEKRGNRLLIHGGGWGIGGDMGRIEEINGGGFDLDIVLYDKGEPQKPGSGNRHYLLDFNWNPWDKNEDGLHEFPPTYEVGDMCSLIPMKGGDYHPIFGLCLKDKGIISKPGGGTLLDSMASATPIIFTEPAAGHEKANADMWESLGFGISYSKWKEAGFLPGLLEQMHNNLMEIRAGVPDYTECFIARYNTCFNK